MDETKYQRGKELQRGAILSKVVKAVTLNKPGDEVDELLSVHGCIPVGDSSIN